jgi:hypothetical protein
MSKDDYETKVPEDVRNKNQEKVSSCMRNYIFYKNFNL